MADSEGFYQQALLYDVGSDGVPADVETAVICYEKACVGGHVEAMYNLGVIYITGQGSIEADAKKAIRYFEQAADKGHIKALYNLGLIYTHGKGSISPDIEKAIAYFNQAAQGGSIKSVYNLAVIYQNGLGNIPSHTERAIRYYELVAKEGHAQAMHNLGVIYMHGRQGNDQDRTSIQPDVQIAVNYFYMAAKQGLVDSMFNLGLIFEHQHGEVLPNLDLSIHFYSQAAQKGHIDAMMHLGHIYEHGRNECSLSSDIEMAISCYEQAVIHGNNIDAMFRLGVIYCKGNEKVPMNVEKGVHFYELACQSGHIASLCNLGVIYTNGKGSIPSDITKAIKYLQQAAHSGSIEATFNLGVIYATGRETIPIDMIQAAQYYEEAAKGGYADAMFNLGVIYQYGYIDTILTDKDKAIQYYEQAISHGHANAMLNLAILYEHDIGDVLKAIEYYQQAIEKGNTAALYNLAIVYDIGRKGILESNVVKAIDYYEQAAKLGQSKGWYNLATIYVNGQGDIGIDMDKAIAYYLQAVESGDLEAMYNLGIIYTYGRNNVQPDKQKAYSIWQQGANYPITSEESSSLSMSEKEKKEKERWTRNWCRYQLGEVYKSQNQPKLARDMFTLTIHEDFYMGYLGLASLSIDNDIVRIDYLIQAAEHGIVLAWRHLGDYIEHSHLHNVWSVDNIAMLHSMLAVDKQQQYLDEWQYWHTDITEEDANTCMICAKERSYNLQYGPEQQSYVPPSSHLDCNGFAEHPNTAMTIGSGGQGDVIMMKLYSIHGTSKLVALKRSNRHNEMIIETELRYLQVMRGCPYIVQCLGHTVFDNYKYYLVMEGARYSDLNSLLLNPCISEYLQSIAGFSLIIRWMYEIVNALMYIHRLYIRHGDLKPHNVLVFDGLHVKITDFGLSNKPTGSTSTPLPAVLEGKKSLRMSNDSDNERDDCSSLTVTNVQGTDIYLPPEQRTSQRPTLASDIFSFGVTCVHIINRKKPGLSFKPAFQEAQRQCLESYGHQFGKEVNQLMSLVERCLAVSKDDRPSAKECVDNLTILIDNVPCDDSTIAGLTQSCEFSSF